MKQEEQDKLNDWSAWNQAFLKGDFSWLPPVATKPFRSSMNQRFSKGLFYEEWSRQPLETRSVCPPFTLNRWIPHCINFGRAYVKTLDKTGITITNQLLPDFEFWNHLNRSPWFRAERELWDKEIDATLRSKAMKKALEILENEDDKSALALNAAKFVKSETDKETRSTKSRGRPTKEEVEGALKNEVNDRRTLNEDLERIGLVG